MREDISTVQAASDRDTKPATGVTLEDKYAKVDGRIYLSGIQALVRLPMMQRLRDQAAGLNTAGFVSGYRGSPLGMLDEALWKAQPHLFHRKVVASIPTKISCR